MFYEGIHWFGNISPNPVDPLIKANFMLSWWKMLIMANANYIQLLILVDQCYDLMCIQVSYYSCNISNQ